MLRQRAPVFAISNSTFMKRTPMPIVYSALMCHAPIVVPEVAGAEASKCAGTTRAMREVADRAVRTRPDRVVLLSPHTPRQDHEWAARRGPHEGNLGLFGAPNIRVSVPDAPEVAKALGLRAVVHFSLDHGAAVPLVFLTQAGWHGPTAVLSLPSDETGAASLARALAALPGKTAIIASGDMSHRLLPNAPSGYHPHARDFDRSFVQALTAGDYGHTGELPWRSQAAEDVVTTTQVATEAALEAAGRSRAPGGADVICYEGPWGVGYTEAVFYDEAPPLYAVARRALADHFAGRSPTIPRGGLPSEPLFVTLRSRDGDLRGCIGHLAPQERSLYEEVVAVAMASATMDDRMESLRSEELPDLDLEVSVLDPAERVTSPKDLDPARYGVIVTSGRSQAVLLPGLEGIETPEVQIAAARRKAGMSATAPIQIERFTVRKEVRP
jgi:AmmeMemoRadiSam system protein A